MNKGKLFFGLIMISVLSPFIMVWISFVGDENSFPPLFTLRRNWIIIKTILFGATVSSVVISVSFLLAYLLIRSGIMKKKIQVTLIAFMMVPPFIHAFLWMNSLYVFFGIVSLSGFPISVIVQSVYLLPLGCLLWFHFFLQIDEVYFFEIIMNTSRGKGHFTTCRTMATPMIGIVGLLIFLISIMDYTIPSIFAFNTFPLEIMSVFSSHYQLGIPLIIGIPMSLAALVIISFINHRIKSYEINFERIATSYEYTTKSNKSIQRIVFFLIMLISIPVVLMIVDGVQTKNIFSILLSYKEDYVFSLVTGVIGAIVIIVISYSLNYIILIQPRKKRIIFLFIILLFSLPSTIVGLLVNSLYTSMTGWFSGMEWLYYSYIPTIHVYILRFLPIGFLILNFGFKSISLCGVEAVRLETKKIHRILKIATWNQLKEYILSALFICIILSVGELGGTIMVVPPGKSTITITIYNYLHYGSTDIVAAISIGLMMLIVTLFLVFLWLFSSRKRCKLL